jgi:hypothetical protein
MVVGMSARGWLWRVDDGRILSRNDATAHYSTIVDNGDLQVEPSGYFVADRCEA